MNGKRTVGVSLNPDTSDEDAKLLNWLYSDVAHDSPSAKMRRALLVLLAQESEGGVPYEPPRVFGGQGRPLVGRPDILGDFRRKTGKK